MLKQVWLAECDLCGYKETSETIVSPEMFRENPGNILKGWTKGFTIDFHLCPKCSALVQSEE